MNTLPTQERLKELFDYDAETGVFKWLVDKKPRGKAGEVAGCYAEGDYLRLSVDGKLCLGHQMAWLWAHGTVPPMIDHIDGDKHNNALSNLRAANHKRNAQNMKRAATNKSGCTGVSWDKRRGKWRATIVVDQRHRELGRFDNLDEAVAMRKQAEKEHGFHANHGRSVAI